MRNELLELVEKFSCDIDYYKNLTGSYNEMSCRLEFIDPFLRLLGWDIENRQGLPPQYREVIVENFSVTTDKPDYTFTLRGVKKLFVEAKKPAINITSSSGPALQIRKYGWNANHKIGILTNFEYIMFYDTSILPINSDNSTTALLKTYHYLEYVEKFDEICSIISRESVYTGKFDQYLSLNFAQDDRMRVQVDELFLAQINSWRVSLSNYLYQQSPKYGLIDQLNDVVQGFINQIIFLRICEDKNLPLYHQLAETIQTPSSLKDNLTMLFVSADNRYNSGLFKGDYIIFDLNNEIIIEIIESLYYPKSPYLFNIIGPNILGMVYEVFLTEQLVLSEDNRVILAKKKDCINRSVVTTPSEIVKYMVDMTLHQICSGKTPDEILGLKIVDIACGSGIFLEAVLDYLENYCLEWFLNNDPSRLVEIDVNKYKLPLEFKKTLLVSCIFGVDIDIHAVEVSKFSLILKLIEDESAPSVLNSNPILPNLDCNILFGNSLVQDEYLEQHELTIDERISIVPFNWATINSGNKFDVVLCNPPYVNTEDMHKLIPEKEFEVYRSQYITSHKQFDKYYLFVEKSIEILSERGLATLIVPNKFFKIDSGSKLRTLISDAKLLYRLDDFGDIQLFSEKTIYSSILFLSREMSDSFRYTRVGSVLSLWAGIENNTIEIDSSILDNRPWRLTTDKALAQLLLKLDKKSICLSKYVNIFNGIQTSAERPEPVYWFTSDEILSEYDDFYIFRRNGLDYQIEKKILRPFFKPTKLSEKGLDTYSMLVTDKWIIFPYDNDGKLFSVEKMTRLFPGAYSYLLSQHDRLLPKSMGGKRDVPDANQDNWFQYGRTQALTSFINNPKLIVGILSKCPMYLYDVDDMLIASGGTAGYCAISNKEDSPYSLLYIQAWLTHPITETLIRICGSDFENGFIARGTFVLNTLPFVELNFNDPKHKELHQNVVSLTREIFEINKRLALNPTKSGFKVLVSEKTRLISKIENLISYVYSL